MPVEDHLKAFKIAFSSQNFGTIRDLFRASQDLPADDLEEFNSALTKYLNNDSKRLAEVVDERGNSVAMHLAVSGHEKSFEHFSKFIPWNHYKEVLRISISSQIPDRSQKVFDAMRVRSEKLKKDPTAFGTAIKEQIRGSNLFEAVVLHEHIPLIKQLMLTDCNAKCGRGKNSILSFAVCENRSAVVDYLIYKYERYVEDEITKIDDNKRSALFYSIGTPQFKKLYPIALKLQYDFNQRDIETSSILIHSANLGDVEAMKLLLQTPGIEDQAVDSKGRNILHHAIMSGNMNALNLVIERGIEKFNNPDNQGITPLMIAASMELGGDKLAVAKTLMDIGVDLTLVDGAKRNVAFHAALSGDKDLLRQLADRCDFFAKDKNDCSAMHLMCLSALNEKDTAQKDSWRDLINDICNSRNINIPQIDDFIMLHAVQILASLKYSDKDMPLPGKINLADIELQILRRGGFLNGGNEVIDEEKLGSESIEALVTMAGIDNPHLSQRSLIIKSSIPDHFSYFVVKPDVQGMVQDVYYIDSTNPISKGSPMAAAEHISLPQPQELDKLRQVLARLKTKDSVYKFWSGHNSTFDDLTSKLQTQDNCSSKSLDMTVKHLLRHDYGKSEVDCKAQHVKLKTALIESAISIAKTFISHDNEAYKNMAKEIVDGIRSHAEKKLTSSDTVKSQRAQNFLKLVEARKSSSR